MKQHLPNHMTPKPNLTSAIRVRQPRRFNDTLSAINAWNANQAAVNAWEASQAQSAPGAGSSNIPPSATQ